MMKNLLPLAFLIFQTQILAQPHPAWRHYTLENGLPDNTVYGICSDSTGHLWFATNTGICRFDGYSFRRFPATAAAGEVNQASVFCPQADSLGRVWFSNLVNQYFFIENDSIHAWQWNHLLEPFKGKFNTSTEFTFFENNSLVIQLNHFGFVRIFHDGRVETWENTRSHGHLVKISGKGNFWRLSAGKAYPKSENEYFSQLVRKNKKHLPVCIHEPFFAADSIEGLPTETESNFLMAVKLGKRHFLFTSVFEACETRDGKVVRRGFLQADRSDISPVQLHFLPDGRLMLPLIQQGAGLLIFKNVDALFAHQPDTMLLRGEETTMLFFDQNGGQWVSTLKNGVFYLPNPQLAVWDEQSGLPFGGAVHLAAGRAGGLFFTTADNRLFRMDTERLHFQEIARPIQNFIKTLFFDAKMNRLLVGSSLAYFLENGHWKQIIHARPDGSIGHPLINALHPSRDGQSLFWASTASFQMFSRKNLKYQNEIIGNRFFTLTETPDGRVWAANPNGLHEWRQGDSCFVPVADLPEALRHRIRQMDWTADGTLVAATASNGMVFWKKDQFFKKISTSEGLTSDVIPCFFLQGDSILWAGSNSGLNKITGWRASENLRVEQITRAHGLPSNQINALVFADGFLWVATSGGLVRLSDLPRKSAAARPFLSEIFVQNQKLTDRKTQFPAEQNNFQFKFYALNYTQNGQIEYRFRLAEDAAWQQTSATEALFSSLAPGKYRFEVQAQNEDKIWGESTLFEFEIRPPWWATWWFRGLIFGLAAAAIFSFYKWRTGRLKHRFALQKQISELEQTALRAQMNPHFISNCLNSIQKLVLENDNSAAVRYLARFAKLTRSALEFSGRSEVPLDEEIAYLQNFLALEKLRFKEKFDFKIETDAALDWEKTVLPPMLVQPLVENALKHGFEKMPTGGWLEIRFLKKENLLRIEVLDNGQGLPTDQNSKTSKLENTSKSHALNILRRRFDLMREAGQRYFFEILNRADGRSGVLAVLEVPSKN